MFSIIIYTTGIVALIAGSAYIGMKIAAFVIETREAIADCKMLYKRYTELDDRVYKLENRRS